MRAIFIDEPGKTSLRDMERPVPGSGEVLLKVNYVGFCGSDLSTYLGKNPMVHYPRIPGHEISGDIVELSAGVPEGFITGMPVTVIPYNSCGTCIACSRGRNNACRFNRTLGVQQDGAMQDYLAVPWQKIVSAAGLDRLELAMVEPLSIGFHAVERGRVTGADTVMVLGCGMIGNGAVAGAARRGATVIAVDMVDHKLERALEMGATHTINAGSEDLHVALKRLTGGEGPDVVVEAAGNPVTYLSMMEEVAFAGRVVCIGYTEKKVPCATSLFVQKEIDLMGSRNATEADFKAVITYLEKRKFPLDKMISGSVMPEDAGTAFRAWAEDPGSIMKLLLDLTDPV